MKESIIIWNPFFPVAKNISAEERVEFERQAKLEAEGRTEQAEMELKEIREEIENSERN